MAHRDHDFSNPEECPGCRINLMPLLVGIVLLQAITLLQHCGEAQASEVLGADTTNVQRADKRPVTIDAEAIRVCRVLDGDTIDVVQAGGNCEADPLKRIRMWAIDAPEKKQDRGLDARAQLQRQIDKNPDLRAECFSKDKYDRYLCVLIGETPAGDRYDINRWMVLHGWAWDYTAYSNGFYLEQQEKARAARRGIWKSRSVERPSDFRKRGKRKEPRHGAIRMRWPQVV